MNNMYRDARAVYRPSTIRHLRLEYVPHSTLECAKDNLAALSTLVSVLGGRLAQRDTLSGADAGLCNVVVDGFLGDDVIDLCSVDD